MVNFLKNFINRFYCYFNKIIFNYKSQKISKLFRKLSKLNKIYIYDFGAGLRYLPTLLKFDGISKIHLIDPNDNLEVSYKNLKNLFLDKSSIKKYKVAISEKNEKIFYYPAKQSTGSSFINLKKIGKEKEFSQSYFGDEKKILKQVYDFETFKKKNHLKNPDIIKIDVEGFEFKILKSILKKNKPLIIEIEVNFDSSLTGDTFLQVHNILKKNNYRLNTIYPVYRINDDKIGGEKDIFLKGDYHNPLSRNEINQSDCYYILDKKYYDLRDVVMLFGYGFVIKAKKEFVKIKKNLEATQIKILEKLFKLL